MTTSSYDIIAEVYDEDMGRNVGDEDVRFYVKQCADSLSKVLEMGCGTGRIAIPLVKAGCTVIGIDSSAAMLERLRLKSQTELSQEEQKRIAWCHADMSTYRSQRQFHRVICPYSAFTYVVDDGERRVALESVRRNLLPNGRFVLDVFVPNKQYADLPETHVFHDYERSLPDGTLLKRTKTIRQDHATKINVITRRYEFLDSNGRPIKDLIMVDRIRTYEPNDLRAMLEENGFDVIDICADFDGRNFTKDTRTAAFVCRTKARSS